MKTSFALQRRTARAVLLGCLLVLAPAGIITSDLLAQAAVEGVVRLPSPPSQAFKPPRYKGQNIQVEPPEPPRAVVYLEGAFAQTPQPAENVAVKQKGFQFVPAILPVQIGTSVEFPNLDEEYHNVLSYSRPATFDLGRYRPDEKPPTVRFDKPGVVNLGCEIHEHMKGTILVLETPHFVTTDTNGVYRLENLPAGKYELKAWIDRRTAWSQSVELKDGQELKVNFPAEQAKAGD